MQLRGRISVLQLLLTSPKTSTDSVTVVGIGDTSIRREGGGRGQDLIVMILHHSFVQIFSPINGRCRSCVISHGLAQKITEFTLDQLSTITCKLSIEKIFQTDLVHRKTESQLKVLKKNDSCARFLLAPLASAPRT